MNRKVVFFIVCIVSLILVYVYGVKTTLRWRMRALTAEKMLSEMAHSQQADKEVEPIGPAAIGIQPYKSTYQSPCTHLNDTNINCLLPSRSLTVVIAFPPKQFEMVEQNIKSWSLDEFFPCSRPADGPRADLCFYVSRLNQTTRNRIRSLVSSGRSLRWRSQCFRHVYVRNAGLSEADDQYGPGTVSLFYNVFAFPPDVASPPPSAQATLDDGFSTANNPPVEHRDEPVLARRTDYVLWMEPDLRPIRQFWLTKLLDEISLHQDPVWMLGSIPRYPDHGSWTYNFHLNGNAVYNFFDERFINYILQSRGAWDEFISFDLSLMHYRVKNYKLAQLYEHKFQATDTIQNRGYQDVTLTTFRLRNPNCFLVHGKSIVNAIGRHISENQLHVFTG